MNTTSNKGRRSAYAAWSAGFLGLLALGLALAGCSDHGPVGIYSPELFNKHVAAPDLAYYQYTVYNGGNITFTTSTTSGTSPSNANIQPLVVIVNTGGSGTYGPVQASFSCPSDTNLVFEAGNYGGAWTSDAQDAPNGIATGVSQQGAGNEILGFSQTQVALYQGYYNKGAGSEVTLGNNLEYSFNAYYKPNPAYSNGQLFGLTVLLTMLDGFGSTYQSSFDIWIVQDNN